MNRPPPEALPSDSVTITEFKGMNNTVAAERLLLGELEDALNVDIDDRGQLRRRRGATLLISGSFHSLHTVESGMIYGVRDGVLVRIRDDLTVVSLGTSIGSHPVAFVQVGTAVYFSSLAASGVIYSDDSVGPWGQLVSEGTWESPIVNPTATLFEVRGRLMGRPPLATDLAHFNGRIYLANGPTLWATDLYRYHSVDKTKNFKQFESDITMIRAVKDGLYVGTERDVSFLSGQTFHDMGRRSVARVGVVPGSAAMVPGELVGPQSAGPKAATPAVMFLTDNGVYVGLEGGTCFNLTETMVFPDAVRAAAMYRDQDGIAQYVAATDTGGTPASSARIGDYVDVEIRRAPGAA